MIVVHTSFIVIFHKTSCRVKTQTPNCLRLFVGATSTCFFSKWKVNLGLKQLVTSVSSSNTQLIYCNATAINETGNVPRGKVGISQV